MHQGPGEAVGPLIVEVEDAMPLRRARSIAGAVLPFVGVALFAGALVVLHRELAAHGYREIAQAFGSLTPGALLVATVLTGLSFGVLTGFDALAVRYAGAAIEYGRTAFASFVGFAFCHALACPLLSGGSVRDRLYSAWGLSTLEIGRLLAFNAVTGWVGLSSVLGGALLLRPLETASATGLPVGVVQGAGGLAVAVVLGYGAWTVGSGRSLRIGSWEMPAPSPLQVAGQVGAGVAHVGVAASVLYVLLPAGHDVGWLPFAAAFAGAQIVGRLSRVPGGLGVFEAAFLVLLSGTVSAGSAAAALVAYRIVYNVLPLLVAAGVLALYEAGRRPEMVGQAVDAFGRGVSAVTPLALSGTVFVAGVVLLLTGSIPLGEARLGWVGRLLPISVLEITHFLGSLIGAGLLVLAWGLRQRLSAAYALTLVLLATGAGASVVRGLGWLQAGALLAVLVALLPARREFFRKASLASVVPSRQWAAVVAVTLAGTVWLGLFAYRRVDYSTELWWQFAFQGDAPRFLRASVGAAAFFLVYGLSRLLRPAVPEDPSGPLEAVLPDVETIVDRSDRAHAALVYLGDKDVLLSKSRSAFVMYAVEGRSWVALGDPLGEAEDFDELIWRFRKLAFRHGGWPVFYQARPSCLPLYVNAGLSAVKLGEEGYVPLEGFGLEGSERRGLRRTVKKVEEAGASFGVVPPHEVPSVLPSLRRISEAWLEEKSGREKGFSLGFFDEGYLRRTPVAVLRVEGEVVAFANVLASGGRDELSADIMRFGPGAPPSAMEYLFIRLMLWGAENGYGRFSLGMAPLSGLDTRPLAPLWNRLGTALFRHGGHFYNFQGLRAYKEKFRPVWEPRYLLSPGGLAFPRILANVATLIGGGVRGVLTR